MNDFAMQNDTARWLTNVRELPVMRLGHRPAPSRMVTTLVPLRVIAPPSATGLGGFAHAVKVDVRLVSFPLSGVRNDLASNQDPPADIASTAVASLCSAEFWRIIPAGYVSCRNVFSSSVSPSIFATSRCNDCIAAATC